MNKLLLTAALIFPINALADGFLYESCDPISGICFGSPSYGLIDHTVELDPIYVPKLPRYDYIPEKTWAEKYREERARVDAIMRHGAIVDSIRQLNAACRTRAMVGFGYNPVQDRLDCGVR